MREIHVRRLRYPEARRELERQLNAAFMAGERRVHVVHGVGSGRLKKMVADLVQEMGFGSVVERDALMYNPGVTVVDLFPPDQQTLKMYRG
ncbi:MAG: Smr/MutS family protein [Leptospiraceae bacterium]|nr:Smr/MutS family protein [Leptospiraceae bacterium]MCB1314808.1 Smr/MutS family protein [Leptospiraceae bacterium]MCB1322610.1 Smr/MutS family protein [Leptospiraceae bacterium]